ncbi:MAG: 2'-5' RNA ligase family protein [Opitutales bacterium]|nr:2'-5' RNA ligase family protein [Opitutales bacterium]
MKFEHNVYIVMDLSDPLAGAVMRLRERFDARLAGIPVEIGVAGSSGLGTLENDQDPDHVFGILNDLARGIRRFELSFQSLTSFPGTQWHYFEPMDPAPFVRIHDSLKKSGIVFKPSPYPYTPHCSVADLKDRPEDASVLKGLGDPGASCVMDKISVYSLRPDWSCGLLFQALLRPNS